MHAPLILQVIWRWYRAQHTIQFDSDSATKLFCPHFLVLLFVLPAKFILQITILGFEALRHEQQFLHCVFVGGRRPKIPSLLPISRLFIGLQGWLGLIEIGLLRRLTLRGKRNIARLLRSPTLSEQVVGDFMRVDFTKTYAVCFWIMILSSSTGSLKGVREANLVHFVGDFPWITQAAVSVYH